MPQGKGTYVNQFKRKVLGMDRPLTPKQKMEVRVGADEYFLKLTKPPKGYAMTEKTFEARQQAKKRVSAYKKHIK